MSDEYYKKVFSLTCFDMLWLCMPVDTKVRFATMRSAFISDRWQTEYMFLYTAAGFEGSITDCNEGVLEWIDKAAVYNLPLWEGDKIFFRLLEEERPHFSLKLRYVGEELVEAVLDGKVLSEEDKRAMILGRQAFLQGKVTGEQ